jgi:lysophospholipase L1-like esterase
MRTASVIAVITLLLLAGGEITLRVFSISPHIVVSPIFSPNLLGDFEPNLRVINQIPERYPAAFTTNSQGLRSLREIREEKEPGVIRILCLGDSYTMGWGVPDESTYPEQLGAALSKRYPGKRFEVINAGFLFSNVLDHIDYFREKGRRFTPDLVVEQFCYNDIDTDMRRFAVGRQVLRQDAKQKDANALPAWMRRTALYNLAAKIRAGVDAEALKAGMDPRGRSKDVVIKDDINSLLIPPNETNFNLFNGFAVLDESKVASQEIFWSNYCKGLLILKSDVEAIGGQLLFMALPTKYEVEDDLNGHPSVFYPFCNENKVSFWDVSQVFRRVSRKNANAFFLDADGHTSAQGNSVIADELAKRMDIINDKVILKSNDSPLTFANRQSILLNTSNTGQSGKVISVPDVLPPQVDSVELLEAGIVSDNEQPAMVSPQQGQGSLKIHVRTKALMEHATVVSFRRVFNDAMQKNMVSMHYSLDGQNFLELFTVRSDGTGNWDGMENSKVAEVVFPEKGARDLFLRFLFTGKAGLVFDQGEKAPLRRLQINLYPLEGSG